MSKKNLQMLPASVIEAMNAPVIPNGKKEAVKQIRSQMGAFNKVAFHCLTDADGKESLYNAIAYGRKIGGKSYDELALTAVLKLAENPKTAGLCLAFIGRLGTDNQQAKIKAKEAFPVSSVISLIEKAILSGKEDAPTFGERFAEFIAQTNEPQTAKAKIEMVKTVLES